MQTSISSQHRVLAAAAGLFALALFARGVVIAGVSGRDTGFGDIRAFRIQADTVLAGDSPYDLPWDYANYPPLWLIVMPAGLRAWGLTLGIPFDVIFKLPAILIDSLMGVLIFLALVERNIASKSALAWGALCGLNPLMLFNSAYVGQVDALPIGLLFVGVLMATNGKNRWLLFGALVLGLAASFKAYPLVFLPFFLWEAVRRYGWDWIRLAQVIALAGAPLLIQLLPFVAAGQYDAVSRILTYALLQSGGGGLGHAGPLAVVKWLGLPVAKLTVPALTVSPEWGLAGAMLVYVADAYRLLILSKMIFGGGYVTVFLTGRRMDLALSCLLVLLMIFVFVGGYFVYYLMWLVPFAAYLRQRLLVPYTVLGFTLAVTSHPVVNALFWVCSAVWLMRLLAQAGYFSSLGRIGRMVQLARPSVSA